MYHSYIPFLYRSLETIEVVLQVAYLGIGKKTTKSVLVLCWCQVLTSHGLSWDVGPNVGYLNFSNIKC
jgi:hypothetical protein